MSERDSSTDAEVAAYRAESRAVGRKQRLGGFVFVIVGALLSYFAAKAGAAGPAMQWAGYASLAIGWGLMLYAIFLRTRFHRRILAKLD
ncbi:MAG: hypothetical protein JWR59_1531 [Brevundimonas sp.]|nr:hypothetical protein [Brevundimonas sp.]